MTVAKVSERIEEKESWRNAVCACFAGGEKHHLLLVLV